MKINPVANEPSRPETLPVEQSAGVEPDAIFDDLAQLAAYLSGAAIVLITLVDEQGTWCKSAVGLPKDEIASAVAFLNDAHREEKSFVDVGSSNKARLICDMPLLGTDGSILGALSVMDVVPRQLSPEQLAHLQTVARQIVAQVELRLLSAKPRANRGSSLPEESASEERFRHLLESAAAGIGIAHLDGTYIQANAAYCATVGYSEEELLALNYFALTHPDDRERCATLIRRMARNELDSFVVEKRYIQKSGEAVWVWASVSLIPARADEPSYLIAITTDITQQKQTELRLRQSEYLLHIAGRIARLGGWAVEIPSGQVTWSDEVRVLHEVPPGFTPSVEEALNFYTPESRQRLATAYEQSLVDGTSFDLELEIITTSGRRRWVQSSGEVERDASGTIVRVHGAFQDINEKKQAEAYLRDLATRLTNTLESITDAFFTVDCEWRFTYLNREAERLLARSREDLLGRNLWEEFPQAVGSTSDVEYHRAMRENTTVVFEDFYLPLDKWFDVRAFPAKDGLSVYFRDVTALRASSETLRRSEERFQIVARATNVTIYDWDMVTDRVWWNEGVEKLFGYARAELEPDSRAWTKHIHPDDRERVLQTNSLAIERGDDSWSKEYRFLRKDGSIAYVLDRGFLIRDENSVAVRMVGSMVDLSERRQAEEALRASEAQYRLLFSNNPHPMWVYDLETLQFLAVNDIAVTSYGYSEQEFLAMTIREIRPAADIARLEKDIEESPPRRNVGRWQHRKKDGTIIDVEISSDGIIFSGRKARLVLANDVTARLHDEARLREQAALLDKAQDAIMVRDLDHRITYWNQSAERIYGWQAEQVLGLPVQDVLQQDKVAFQRAHEQVMATGEWTGEVTNFTRDGRELLVEVRLTLVRDEAGGPHAVLAINTDITDRKKLEAQFLRAQRLESIGTLAGGIAHDLNNVLAPIIMSLGLLKLHERSPSELRILNILETSAQKGAAMVRQVLSFARGMDGQRTIMQAESVIRDLERLVCDTFDRNIRVTSDVPAYLWPVLGDATQIHQVLLNLCVNARDAMPEGGELKLSAVNIEIDAQYASMNPEAKPGQFVLLKVTDTGSGIPKAIRERIFDPFFTTKEIGKGTGLGLATVQAVVKSHGGFVNVYSEEGRGTEFRIYLPSYAGEGGVTPDAIPIQFRRGRGEIVLVVDDEESVRSITQQTLEAFGYRVLLAEDGADALAVYMQHRAEIAVVLTDMMMPVMDGFATIQALRKINPQVRIVAASGLAANGMVAKAANAGIQHFLSKPYTADAMLRLLSEILETPENGAA